MPSGSETGPDARGVKTIIEYKRNEKGDIVKVTTRIKTSRIEKKVYKVSTPSRVRSSACRTHSIACVRSLC